MINLGKICLQNSPRGEFNFFLGYFDCFIFKYSLKKNIIDGVRDQ